MNDSSVASRIQERRSSQRGRFATIPPRTGSRRTRDESCAADVTSSKRQRRINPNDGAEDISIIKQRFGNLKFHGTGNPLALRSPNTPETLAVDNLAVIIQSGYLGQENSDSTPQLKTEQGSTGGSFWADRVALAGQYGWTGVVLPSDANTSESFPVSDAVWFLVTNQKEMNRLKSEVCSANLQLWSEIKDRTVTIAQLAKRVVKKTEPW
jgi:hypothetical protein